MKADPARLDADRTAQPKTRLVEVKEIIEDGVAQTIYLGPATHIELEDGTRIDLRVSR